ncbi:hypothetical protein OROHE_022343 [Orobanche hederae]
MLADRGDGYDKEEREIGKRTHRYVWRGENKLPSTLIGRE